VYPLERSPLVHEGRKATISDWKTAMENNNLIPYLLVPDMEKSLNWYESIGFKILDKIVDGPDNALIWGKIELYGAKFMLSPGGNSQQNYNIRFFINVSNPDDYYEQIKNKVVIETKPENTFYGRREFMFSDLLGYSFVIGCPIS